jgi:hypothetical protein
MLHRKRWVLVPLLLAGLSLTVLGCSQSDGTSGTRTSAGMAKADTAPAPPVTAAGPSPAAPSSSAMTLTMEATGQVVSADPANKTLIVQSDTGAMAFEVQDRVASELRDLRPGDKVTVRYTQDAGKNSAEAIQKG